MAHGATSDLRSWEEKSEEGVPKEERKISEERTISTGSPVVQARENGRDGGQPGPERGRGRAGQPGSDHRRRADGDHAHPRGSGPWWCWVGQGAKTRCRAPGDEVRVQTRKASDKDQRMDGQERRGKRNGLTGARTQGAVAHTWERGRAAAVRARDSACETGRSVELSTRMLCCYAGRRK